MRSTSQPFIESAKQNPKDFVTLVYAKYSSDQTHAKSWKNLVFHSLSPSTTRNPLPINVDWVLDMVFFGKCFRNVKFL